MRQPGVFLICLLILFAACKKKEETKIETTPAQKRDFALLPVKDASWKIHCTGWYTDPQNNDGTPMDEIPNRVDSALHSYFTVTATGRDTIIYGNRYFIYAEDELYTYSLKLPSGINMPAHYTGRLLLREDSLAQRVYIWGDSLKVDITVVDLRDEDVGKKVSVQPQMEIKYVDSLLIAGMYVKRWQACNSYDKNIEVLYKAYGICTRTGPIPPLWINDGSKVVELDFNYKNDNLHLNFGAY